MMNAMLIRGTAEMTAKRKLLLMVGVGLWLLAVVLYITVLPSRAAHTYNQTMRAGNTTLQASLARTAETTSRAIFTKQDTTLETNAVDLAAIDNRLPRPKRLSQMSKTRTLA